MAFGTFKVTINGDQLGGLPESGATLRIKANTGTIKDDVGDKFIFPRGAQAITLPYSIDLATDVTSGTSTTIGYHVELTTPNGGSVVTEFAARPAGVEVALTDLYDPDFMPVSDGLAIRASAEAAADTAAASATSAAASATNAAASSALWIATNGVQGLALDTDGTPYYDAALTSTTLALLSDTDGAPYLVGA